MTAVRRAGGVLLWVGATLGVVSMLAAVLAVTLDVKPLVFRSGSMAPDIGTGSLALSRTVAAAEVRPGDVVSVVDARGVRVTHRVVSATAHGGETQLVLRGDANPAADPAPYPVTEVERVFADVPHLGAALACGWAKGALMALVLLVALVVMWPRNGWRSRGGLVAAAALVVLGLVAGLARPGMPTLAYWSDTGRLTTGSFTAYTVPVPVWVSCTVTGSLLTQTATIVWQEVSTPYALDYTARVQQTGTNLPVTDNGTTRQTRFNANLLGNLLDQTYHVEIRARLPAPNGAWVSRALVQPVTVTLLGTGMSCGTPTTTASASMASVTGPVESEPVEPEPAPSEEPSGEPTPTETSGPRETTSIETESAEPEPTVEATGPSSAG